MSFPFPFRAGHRSRNQDRGRRLSLETLEPRCAPSGLAESLSPLPHLQLTKLSASKPAEEHLAAPQKSKAPKLAAVKMYVDSNGVTSLTAPKSSSSAIALTISIPQDQVASLKQAFSNTLASPATPRVVIVSLNNVGGMVSFHDLEPTSQIETGVSIVFNHTTVRSGPPWRTQESFALTVNINQLDNLHNDALIDGAGIALEGEFTMHVAADLKSAHAKGTVELYDQHFAKVIPIHVDITLTATSKLFSSAYSTGPGGAEVDAYRTARVSGSVSFAPAEGEGLAREMVVPGSTVNSAISFPQISHVVSVYVGPP